MGANPKCEGCGSPDSDRRLTHINLLNGGLLLCGQCLAEFNGKNPELKALKADNERLRAALEPFADEWRDAVSKHPVFDTTDPEKREKVAWVAGVVKLGDCRRAAELLGAGSPVG